MKLFRGKVKTSEITRRTVKAERYPYEINLHFDDNTCTEINILDHTADSYRTLAYIPSQHSEEIYDLLRKVILEVEKNNKEEPSNG